MTRFMKKSELKQTLKSKMLINGREVLIYIQDYAQKGGSQLECVRALDKLRVEFEQSKDEMLYELTLEMMDLSAGWCSPSNKIWPDNLQNY